MRVTSFSQARDIVRAENESSWDGPGDYYVSEGGFDTGSHYVVIDGAKEYLVDGDPMFMSLDDVTLLVHKRTGRVEATHSFDAMKGSEKWTAVIDADGDTI